MASPVEYLKAKSERRPSERVECTRLLAQLLSRDQLIVRMFQTKDAFRRSRERSSRSELLRPVTASSTTSPILYAARALPHNCAVAKRAPSTMASNFAHMISG